MDGLNCNKIPVYSEIRGDIYDRHTTLNTSSSENNSILKGITHKSNDIQRAEYTFFDEITGFG